MAFLGEGCVRGDAGMCVLLQGKSSIGDGSAGESRHVDLRSSGWMGVPLPKARWIFLCDEIRLFDACFSGVIPQP